MTVEDGMGSCLAFPPAGALVLPSVVLARSEHLGNSEPWCGPTRSSDHT